MSQQEPLNVNEIPDLDLELEEQPIGAKQPDSIDSSIKPEEKLSIERRVAIRFPPNFRGLRGWFRKNTDQLVQWVRKSKYGWPALGVAILMSCLLFWWSLGVRVKLLDDNLYLVSELSDKRTRFAGLLTKFSQEDIQNIREKVSSAETSVFPDYERLALWLSRQSSLAQQFELDMSYTMAEASESEINNVVELPIEIRVAATEVEKSLSYIRMLEFVKSMVHDNWHLEISSASMFSQGQGATNLTAYVKVWVRDASLSVSSTEEVDEGFIE